MDWISFLKSAIHFIIAVFQYMGNTDTDSSEFSILSASEDTNFSNYNGLGANDYSQSPASLEYSGYSTPDTNIGLKCNEVADENTPYNVWSSTKCCGDYEYQRGLVVSDKQVFSECSVPPENNSLSIYTSYWRMYECLAQKSIGTKEMNAVNFANMMLNNLNATKKMEILDLIQSDSLRKDVDDNLAGNKDDELYNIKALYGYFEKAKSMVCTPRRISSQKQLRCQNYTIPFIPFFPEAFGKILDCIATTKTENFVYPCIFLANGLITEGEMANRTFNRESLVLKMIPNYYSLSVREEILQSITDRIQMTSSTSMYRESDTTATAVQSLSEPDENKASKVAFMFADELHKIYNIAKEVVENFCVKTS